MGPGEELTRRPLNATPGEDKGIWEREDVSPHTKKAKCEEDRKREALSPPRRSSSDPAGVVQNNHISLPPVMAVSKRYVLIKTTKKCTQVSSFQ